MTRIKTFLVAATILSATATSLIHWAPAIAHSGARGMVKDRMELMKSLGSSMKSLAAMFQGKTAYNPTKVQQISVRVSKHAEKIPSMFPEGSDKHPSEAKATIWSDRSGFERAASTLGEQAAMLSKVADKKAAAEMSFKQLANTCKACHQDFREKKN